MNTKELFADPLFQLFCQLSRFPSVGIGGAMGVAIHNDSVRHYCAQFLEENGRLPAEQHRIPLRWKNSTSCFDYKFPAEDLSRCLSIGFTHCNAGLDTLGKKAAVVTACEREKLKRIEVTHRWVDGAEPTVCSLPGKHASAEAKARTVLMLLRRIPLNTEDSMRLDSADETPLTSLKLRFKRNEITVQTKEWAPPGDWLHWYIDCGSGSTPLSSPVRHIFLRLANGLGRAAHERA